MLEPRLQTLETERLRQCVTCGHLGTDVAEHLTYIGGQGYVRVMQCQSIPDCWARKDGKEGER